MTDEENRHRLIQSVMREAEEFVRNAAEIDVRGDTGRAILVAAYMQAWFVLDD
jgi:hypothetical protein